MKKLFTTYSIASKLKELGFDEPCLMYYYVNNENKLHSNVSTCTLYGAMISEEEYIIERQIKAPLWQQAITWLLKYHSDKYSCLKVSQFSDESYVLRFDDKELNKDLVCPNVEYLVNKLLEL